MARALIVVFGILLCAQIAWGVNFYGHSSRPASSQVFRRSGDPPGVTRRMSTTFDSVYNQNMASRNYAKSPLERGVVKTLGTTLPRMRDNLVAAKDRGDGFVKRHVEEWSKPNNWKPVPTHPVEESSRPVGING